MSRHWHALSLCHAERKLHIYQLLLGLWVETWWIHFRKSYPQRSHILQSACCVENVFGFIKTSRSLHYHYIQSIDESSKQTFVSANFSYKSFSGITCQVIQIHNKTYYVTEHRKTSKNMNHQSMPNIRVFRKYSLAWRCLYLFNICLFSFP